MAEPAEATLERPPTWREALLPRPGGAYAGVVALAAAISMTVLGTRAGISRLLPAYLGFGVWTALIAAGDIVTKRIPNKLNAAALLSGLVLLTFAGFDQPSSIVRAALGALIAFALYFLLWLLAPAGMGMGDVKLAPYIGAHLAFCSLDALLRGLVFGFLAQAAIVLALLVTRRIGRRAHVPHGPAMCIGAMVSLVSALGSV